MKKVKNEMGYEAFDRNYLEAGDVIKVKINDAVSQGTVTNLSVPTIVVDGKEYSGRIRTQYAKIYLYDPDQNVTVWIEEKISLYRVVWHRTTYTKEGNVSAYGDTIFYLDYELAKEDYLSFYRTFNFRAETLNRISNCKGEVKEEKEKNSIGEEDRKVTIKEYQDKKVRIEESAMFEL